MKKMTVADLPGTAQMNGKQLDALRAIENGGTAIIDAQDIYQVIGAVQRTLCKGLTVNGWNKSLSGHSKRYYDDRGQVQIWLISVEAVDGTTQFYEMWGYWDQAHIAGVAEILQAEAEYAAGLQAGYVKLRIDFMEATTGALKCRDYVEYRREDYTLENIREYLNRRTIIAEANYKTNIIARHYIAE